MQLSNLLTDDSRSPLLKLRRSQLQKIATKEGIKFDPSGPATDLRKLIEGSGVDVTKTGLFEVIQVQDENGRVKDVMEPVVKPHATASKDINYDAILEAKAKAAEKEEENTELKSQIERLEAMVQKLMEPKEGKTLEQEYEDKFGKKPHHKMKPENIRKAIDGNHT